MAAGHATGGPRAGERVPRSRLRAERERGRQVSHAGAYTRQRLEAEPARDQLQDRRRIVERMVDIAALAEGRDDDRGNARAGSPAIGGRWRDVIPPPAVLVVRDDDRHRPELPAGDELRNDVGDMPVAGEDVGVARVLGEAALRLVERDR